MTFTFELTAFAPLFGYASAVLSVIAFAPYIYNTLRGRTVPQRASWLVWSVLSAIAFWAQLHEGASASLWFTGVQVVGATTVFLLSVFCGKGLYFRPFEYFGLCAAAVGLGLWYYCDTAAYALAITIGISLIGGLFTIHKAYLWPASETLGTWLLGTVAATFGALSVAAMDPLLLAYPVYLVVLRVAISLACLGGQLRQRFASLEPVNAPQRTRRPLGPAHMA